MPGVSTNMHLGRRRRMRDADDAAPGGLHLGRDDRDLGADEPVEQRRLADVGRAERWRRSRRARPPSRAWAPQSRPSRLHALEQPAGGRVLGRALGAAARPSAGGWPGEARPRRVNWRRVRRPLGGDDPVGRRLQAARLRPLLQRHLGVARRRLHDLDQERLPGAAPRSRAPPPGRRRGRARRSAPRRRRPASPGLVGPPASRLAARHLEPAAEPEPRRDAGERALLHQRHVPVSQARLPASSGKRSISRWATIRPSTRSPRNSRRS